MDSIFENNTALSSGGAMFVSGLPDPSGQGAADSGTTLVVKGSVSILSQTDQAIRSAACDVVRLCGPSLTSAVML